MSKTCRCGQVAEVYEDGEYLCVEHSSGAGGIARLVSAAWRVIDTHRPYFPPSGPTSSPDEKLQALMKLKSALDALDTTFKTC